MCLSHMFRVNCPCLSHQKSNVRAADSPQSISLSSFTAAKRAVTRSRDCYFPIQTISPILSYIVKCVLIIHPEYIAAQKILIQ